MVAVQLASMLNEEKSLLKLEQNKLKDAQALNSTRIRLYAALHQRKSKGVAFNTSQRQPEMLETHYLYLLYIYIIYSFMTYL